jgi:hypothetical protein
VLLLVEVLTEEVEEGGIVDVATVDVEIAGIDVVTEDRPIS